MSTKNRPGISKLFETLLTTNSLKDAIDTSADVLGNPLAIFDSSYQVLVSSKRSAPDEAWREGIKRGHWNYEFVARLNRIIEEGAERRPGRIMQKPAILTDLSERRRRVESLVLDDTLLGFVVILEDETAFGEVDEADYEVVRKVLAKAVAMDRAAHFHSHARSTEAVLLDILGGRFTDRLLLRERIRGSGMEEAASFSLFTVSLAGYLPDNLREEALKKKLEAIFRLCWSVSEQDYIVILAARSGSPEQREETMRAFTGLLRQHQLQAGQSAEFSDLLLVPRFYRQALRALELSRELSSSPFNTAGSVLFPYESYKILDLISRLSKEELSNYCNSAVLGVFEHDRTHGTEYVRTVFHYLHAGRGIHAAAKALYVHHNTVYYRLTKAKELFGLDFSSEYHNLQYYLSCMMLLYFWDRRHT